MRVNLPCLMGSCPNFLRPTCSYTECLPSFLTGSCTMEWTTASYSSCLSFDSYWPYDSARYVFPRTLTLHLSTGRFVMIHVPWSGSTDQSVHKTFYRNTAPFRESIKYIDSVCITCSFKHDSFFCVLVKKLKDTSPVFPGIPQSFPDFFQPDPGYFRMVTESIPVKKKV